MHTHIHKLREGRQRVTSAGGPQPKTTTRTSEKERKISRTLNRCKHKLRSIYLCAGIYANKFALAHHCQNMGRRRQPTGQLQDRDRRLHQHLCNLLIIVAVVCLYYHLSCIVVVYHTIEEITKNINKFVYEYRI